MQVLSRYTALSSGDACTHNFFFSKCLHSSRVLASGEFQTWPLIPPGTTFPQFSAHAPESRSLTSSQSQDPLYFLAQNECYFFQKKTTLTYYSKSVLLLSNSPEVIIPLVHGLWFSYIQLLSVLFPLLLLLYCFLSSPHLWNQQQSKDFATYSSLTWMRILAESREFMSAMSCPFFPFRWMGSLKFFPTTIVFLSFFLFILTSTESLP